MRYHRNEATKVQNPKLLSIIIETVHEPKDLNSVIRVALSSFGTVKDIKVIGPESTTAPSGAEKEESSKQ